MTNMEITVEIWNSDNSFVRLSIKAQPNSKTVARHTLDKNQLWLRLATGRVFPIRAQTDQIPILYFIMIYFIRLPIKPTRNFSGFKTGFPKPTLDYFVPYRNRFNKPTCETNNLTVFPSAWKFDRLIFDHFCRRFLMSEWQVYDKSYQNRQNPAIRRQQAKKTTLK